ncbi:hypothetical protein HDE_06950 [Halotydeus destructor]|nr:hypothetical protein HDE_06950 [Halotydeus destructor]
MGMANPISTLLPNYILPMKPWFFPDRLRNYVGVFTISFVLSVPSVLYLYFVINEKEDAREDDDSLVSQEENDNVSITSKRKPETDVPWTTAIKSIFILDNLKILVAAVKRKRENGRHKMLWVMLANQAVGFMAVMGSVMVQFQYSEKMFNWNYERYNQVSATFSVVHLVIGAPILIPIFSKGLKMTEPQMGITGCLFWIFSLLVMGLYQHESAVYISQCLSTMGGIIGVTTRAYVTRLIEPDELGSVYSVTAGFQAIMPLAASVIFTQIFNATLNTAPGLVYLISGYLVLFVMITFVIADIHSRLLARSKPDLSIQ